MKKSTVFDIERMKLKYLSSGYISILTLAISGMILSSCDKTAQEVSKTEVKNENRSMKYTALPDSLTGVSFRNDLKEDNRINYFIFPYMYMGGGVSIGDINNDGLADIYFTGNRVENKLYLNKGNMQFEDISRKAGVQGDTRWYTGTTLADVNNDGLLDIYLSVSNAFMQKENQLYINNGDLTFTESAAKYGLNDDGPSVQAGFFDYDNDGDLDMYLANYPATRFSSPNQYYYEKLQNPTDDETDKFFRNDGPNGFVNVTDEVGVRNFGLSLSTSISDYNEDGLMDVYVSNDFISPDFLYINQGDGTFKDELKSYTQHTAQFGMGSDAADINNDGLMDIMQLDMMAEDNKRQKTNMASMNPENFWNAVDLGFHYQYMRNCLQINNGNGSFSDIAELAGVDATNWSWATLLFDMDNDGWKDIFISNGTRRSVNDKDFMKKMHKKQMSGQINMNNLMALIEEMPVVRVSNHIYKNLGNLAFEKKANEWGGDFKGFTNGVAYGDLDNDGDLDLVLNNLDDMAIVYENNASSLKNGNFLTVKLKGKSDNHFGLGTRVRVKSGDLEQWQEMMIVRGFQSSVEPVLHFGLGSNTVVDELEVQWLNGTVQKMTDVKARQIIEIVQESGGKKDLEESTEKLQFIEQLVESGIDYRHIENNFDDFKRQVLLPHKMSQFGPSIAVGDINGDNLEDFYIGGATGEEAALYVQNASGSFSEKSFNVAKKDAIYEDIRAVFFDFENDGDQDLYVVSGGNEFEENSKEYQDRLYINDGKGNFKKSQGLLPEIRTSGSCVIVDDYDKDGDLDLFVGGRHVPGRYPFPTRSYILENNDGRFKDVTEEIAPGLMNVGMVTSALWTDFNADGSRDLMLTGEWMPIRFFEQKDQQFIDRTADYGFENSTGWWFSLAKADIDGDGDEDYVAGNLGLNYKYKGSEKEPFQVYAGDFDKNGTSDIILGYYEDGKAFPVRGLQCSSEQIPAIQEKYTTYRSFGDATLDKVYGKNILDSGLHYEAKMFSSSYIENKGNGKFEIKALPNMAQISCVNSILLYDFDKDGNKDILIAGNMHGSEVETPRNDAGIGLWLKGNGAGDFTPVSSRKSGFYAPYVVNEMKLLKGNNRTIILLGNNNERLQSFVLNSANQAL